MMWLKVKRDGGNTSYFNSDYVFLVQHKTKGDKPSVTIFFNKEAGSPPIDVTNEEGVEDVVGWFNQATD